MSFFNWFPGKSRQASSNADFQAKQTLVKRQKQPASRPQRLAPGAESHEHNRKLKRYASREQLYVAIREAMTRAGILSASYKFKVLFLDPQDSEFLVMMDLSTVAGDLSPQTGEIETLIVRNAKARFDITVSAVYWRVNEVPAASRPMRYFPLASVVVKTDLKPVPVAHEAIEADEMAAFQRALLGGSARPGPDIAPGQDVKGRRRSDLRIQPSGFEDTEVSESVSFRSLSITQYGDLN